MSSGSDTSHKQGASRIRCKQLCPRIKDAPDVFMDREKLCRAACRLPDGQGLPAASGRKRCSNKTVACMLLAVAALLRTCKCAHVCACVMLRTMSLCLCPFPLPSHLPDPQLKPRPCVLMAGRSATVKMSDLSLCPAFGMFHFTIPPNLHPANAPLATAAKSNHTPQPAEHRKGNVT